MAYVLRGVRPYGEEPVDIVVSDGVITELAPAGSGTGDVIDSDGLVALPGFVDLHTHLREPGREDAETVLTGSRAAALGGYTCVHAMANTNPVADTAGVVEQVWRLGQVAGLVDVRPVGAVTVGLDGCPAERGQGNHTPRMEHSPVEAGPFVPGPAPLTCLRCRRPRTRATVARRSRNPQALPPTCSPARACARDPATTGWS